MVVGDMLKLAGIVEGRQMAEGEGGMELEDKLRNEVGVGMKGMVMVSGRQQLVTDKKLQMLAMV